MIKTIGDIIHKAIDEAPYQVQIDKDKFCVIDKTAHNGSVIVFSSPLHDQAEDMMDAFNDAWIARKVVEGIKNLGDYSWLKTCERILSSDNISGTASG